MIDIEEEVNKFCERYKVNRDYVCVIPYLNNKGVFIVNRDKCSDKLFEKIMKKVEKAERRGC